MVKPPVPEMTPSNWLLALLAPMVRVPLPRETPVVVLEVDGVLKLDSVCEYPLRLNAEAVLVVMLTAAVLGKAMFAPSARVPAAMVVRPV